MLSGKHFLPCPCMRRPNLQRRSQAGRYKTYCQEPDEFEYDGAKQPSTRTRTPRATPRRDPRKENFAHHQDGNHQTQVPGEAKIWHHEAMQRGIRKNFLAGTIPKRTTGPRTPREVGKMKCPGLQKGNHKDRDRRRPKEPRAPGEAMRNVLALEATGDLSPRWSSRPHHPGLHRPHKIVDKNNSQITSRKVADNQNRNDLYRNERTNKTFAPTKSHIEHLVAGRTFRQTRTTASSRSPRMAASCSPYCDTIANRTGHRMCLLCPRGTTQEALSSTSSPGSPSSRRQGWNGRPPTTLTATASSASTSTRRSTRWSESCPAGIRRGFHFPPLSRGPFATGNGSYREHLPLAFLANFERHHTCASASSAQHRNTRQLWSDCMLAALPFPCREVRREQHTCTPTYYCMKYFYANGRYSSCVRCLHASNGEAAPDRLACRSIGEKNHDSLGATRTTHLTHEVSPHASCIISAHAMHLACLCNCSSLILRIIWHSP